MKTKRYYLILFAAFFICDTFGFASFFIFGILGWVIHWVVEPDNLILNSVASLLTFWWVGREHVARKDWLIFSHLIFYVSSAYWRVGFASIINAPACYCVDDGIIILLLSSMLTWAGILSLDAFRRWYRINRLKEQAFSA